MSFRLLLVIGIVFTSCGRSYEHEQATDGSDKNRSPATKQSSIVAGPGEKTFEENHGVKLSLPMPESDFLALLNRIGLQYAVIGNRAKNIEISVPRHSQTMDLSAIQRDYYIRGEVDRVHHVGKDYLAYVDRSDQVVYIENNFVYYDAP